MIQTEFENGLQLGILGYIPTEKQAFNIQEKINYVKLNQLVIFCHKRIINETEKAILIEREDINKQNRNYWFPKSRILKEGKIKDFLYIETDTFLFDKVEFVKPKVRTASRQEDYIGYEDYGQNNYYNDNLDLDQQSPEFWDNL